jgi:hypothetical protein
VVGLTSDGTNWHFLANGSEVTSAAITVSGEPSSVSLVASNDELAAQETVVFSSFSYRSSD